MRSSILGLFLAAIATFVVCDDCQCEPPQPYSPPGGSSVGAPPGYNPGGPVKGLSPAPAVNPGGRDKGVNPGGPVYISPAGPPSGVNPCGPIQSANPPQSSASSGGIPLGTYNSPDNRQQWGQYDINTDYNTIVPDTGVIREVCILEIPS
jgi:hypothetical protein